MTVNQTKRVIVVLSPGRSGSSLLMKALGAMGMSLSENMIPGSVSNPEGFFEDEEIVQVHKELLENLYTKPTLPMPDNWLESKPANQARGNLKKIIENRMSNCDSIWGFKDPRTVSLLPLWLKILNAPGIVPVFLIAVRDPGAVVMSLMRNINREGAITENQWLTRTTDALQYTAADCYIVHYEDWFSRPNELSQELLQYTGLDQYFTGNLDETIKNVIRPNLNRAGYDDYTVKNKYVLKLYNVLKKCRGIDFDRGSLLDVVKQCRTAMDGFKGWYIEAHKHIKSAKNIQKKHYRIPLPHDEDMGIQHDVQILTLQNNDYLKQIKDMHDEIENLRKKFVGHQREPKIQPNNTDKRSSALTPGYLANQEKPNDYQKLRKEVIALRHGYSFRLGQIFINAFVKPGKNTLLAPYYLAVLIWDIATGRGRDKVRKELEQNS